MASSIVDRGTGAVIIVDYLKISVPDFAKRIDVDFAYLESVVEEKAPITAKLAEKISSVITGPSPDTWIAMQKDYDQWEKTK